MRARSGFAIPARTSRFASRASRPPTFGTCEPASRERRLRRPGRRRARSTRSSRRGRPGEEGPRQRRPRAPDGGRRRARRNDPIRVKASPVGQARGKSRSTATALARPGAAPRRLAPEVPANAGPAGPDRRPLRNPARVRTGRAEVGRPTAALLGKLSSPTFDAKPAAVTRPRPTSRDARARSGRRRKRGRMGSGG